MGTILGKQSLAPHPQDHLLLIVGYISTVIFALSFRRHKKLSLQVSAWSTMEAYFTNFLTECSSNNSLSVVYHSYRYYSVKSAENSIVQGALLFHKMIGFVILAEDSHIPTDSFPIYSWGIYTFLLLEKRLLRVAYHIRSVSANGLVPTAQEHPYRITLTICLVVCLITIFGLFIFKKIKSEEENFWICVWEVMKIAFMCFHKEISIKTK